MLLRMFWRVGNLSDGRPQSGAQRDEGRLQRKRNRKRFETGFCPGPRLLAPGAEMHSAERETGGLANGPAASQAVARRSGCLPAGPVSASPVGQDDHALFNHPGKRGHFYFALTRVPRGIDGGSMVMYDLSFPRFILFLALSLGSHLAWLASCLASRYVRRQNLSAAAARCILTPGADLALCTFHFAKRFPVRGRGASPDDPSFQLCFGCLLIPNTHWTDCGHRHRSERGGRGGRADRSAE